MSYNKNAIYMYIINSNSRAGQYNCKRISELIKSSEKEL